MAEISNISWTDATVNFWWGCTKVGPGCDHCYAEGFSKRVGRDIWGPGEPRWKIESAAEDVVEKSPTPVDNFCVIAEEADADERQI